MPGMTMSPISMKSLKELDDIGPLISELGDVIEAQRLAFAEEDFEEFHRQSSLFHGGEHQDCISGKEPAGVQCRTGISELRSS